MKSVIAILLVFILSLFFGVISPKRAQAQPQPPQRPNEPKLVSIDGPLKAPAEPPLTANMMELRFGSQATGVESCLQLVIRNNSNSAQTITKLIILDEKHYKIPSPSHEMLPISIQPHTPLTLSVCFKTEKIGEFKTKLVIGTAADSVIIPVEGKGIKPEDVGKLPKTDFSVIKNKKKKNQWDLKYQLTMQSKVTLQLFDDLGAMKFMFLNGAFKNEGTYEMPFDGTDKTKGNLAPGKYYVRCQIEEVTRGNQKSIFTKELVIK